MTDEKQKRRDEAAAWAAQERAALDAPPGPSPRARTTIRVAQAPALRAIGQCRRSARKRPTRAVEICRILSWCHP